MSRGVGIRAVLIAALLVLFAIPVHAQSPVPGVPEPDGLTFTMLATTAGATVAAGIIYALVQVIKSAFPGFSTRMSGAAQAFVLSAVLYAVTAAVLRPTAADGYLVIFISWLNCALASVGIHSTTVQASVSAGVRALQTPKVAARALDALAANGTLPPGTVEVREVETEFAVPVAPVEPVAAKSRRRTPAEPDNA